jgi:hypothetical protein
MQAVSNSVKITMYKCISSLKIVMLNMRYDAHALFLLLGEMVLLGLATDIRLSCI